MKFSNRLRGQVANQHCQNTAPSPSLNSGRRLSLAKLSVVQLRWRWTGIPTLTADRASELTWTIPQTWWAWLVQGTMSRGVCADRRCLRGDVGVLATGEVIHERRMYL